MTDLPQVHQTILFDGRRVVSHRAVHGGSINETSYVKLNDGAEYLLKSNSLRYEKMFACEANGLKELAKIDQGVAVPQVHGFHVIDQKQYLLLEWVPVETESKQFWKNFGEQLAFQHQYKANKFGFFEDNFIGSTQQINEFNSSWLDFFSCHRILYQMQLAKKFFAPEQMKLMQLFLNRLPRLLEGCIDQPVLMHGDLWSGNFLVGPQGKPYLIDPAVYYGDPEADLAMTYLFGGFSPAFYQAYHSILPIKKGYERRLEVYKVYHLLNHLNLFGSSYLRQTLSVVDCLVKS